MQVIYRYPKKKELSTYKKHIKTITNEISYGMLDCKNHEQIKKMAKEIIDRIKIDLSAWSKREKEIKYVDNGLRRADGKKAQNKRLCI